MMKTLLRALIWIGVIVLVVALGAPATGVTTAAGACGGANCLYLPSITVGCKAVGGSYTSGLAIQYDLDNPPRPTSTFIGKNLRYRGYEEVTNQTGYTKGLLDYGPGSEDPSGTTPPQFRTLFSPARDPDSNQMRFFRTYNWNDQPSPDPGTRGSVITDPPVTVLGLPTAAGETIYSPAWSRQINAGIAAMVMYADFNTVTIAYHREDSAGDVGYTVYIDNICTDPNLVSLYQSLDANPNRYLFSFRGAETYSLPYLFPNQAIGTARDSHVMVAIADSGPVMDPRSCRGWWLDLVGTGACPLRDGNTVR